LPALYKSSAYISAGQIDHVFQEMQLLNSKLRTIRDLIDAHGDRSLALQKFNDGFLPTASGIKIPTVTKLYADLEAIEKNFPEVIIAPQIIAVVTDNIVLTCPKHGDLDLGQFHIVLDLLEYSVKESSPYRIGAVDPQYDVASEEYVHPHVNNYILCEGEAQTSIQRALDEGRFYDFFRIIYSTLIVYNDGSPYQRIELWFEQGLSCSECGEGMDEDNSYSCEDCGASLCESCIKYCDLASVYFCRSCIENGLDCGNCNDRGAEGCLDHENDYCELCSSIPTDAEQVQCDNSRTFHHSCISDITELPGFCEGCSFLENCALISDELKPKEEEEEEEAADDSEDQDKDEA